MKNERFLRGMGMGLAVGAAVCALLPGKAKRRKKSTAAKAIRSVTNMMDDLSDALNL